jgi:hypothetical protein
MSEQRRRLRDSQGVRWTPDLPTTFGSSVTTSSKILDRVLVRKKLIRTVHAPLTQPRPYSHSSGSTETEVVRRRRTGDGVSCRRCPTATVRKWPMAAGLHRRGTTGRSVTPHHHRRWRDPRCGTMRCPHPEASYRSRPDTDRTPSVDRSMGTRVVRTRIVRLRVTHCVRRARLSETRSQRIQYQRQPRGRSAHAPPASTAAASNACSCRRPTPK